MVVNRWRPQDLARWVDAKRRPLRNGVFQTCAMLCGPISYRRCVNGVWFQPRDTAAEAAACELVAVDAPHWWRGLIRNLAPVVDLRLVTGCNPDCPNCVARREDGARSLALFDETSALLDSLRGVQC